ncbi:MAG: exodeoxyribonuclease VII large subunit, partial [Bacteroidota bacterium]
RATIWSNTFRGIGSWFESITGERLRPGLKVLVQAEVKFHHLYGLSLNVKDIDAKFTLGERALKRQEVINQLIEDGVFDMNKGLTLPLVPQRIAVISSPAAAGFGDFMDQLEKNRFGYQFGIKLFKAKMQGNDASDSIIQALHQIFDLQEQDDCFDCVVIIRGGGAQVDLDCFDSYDVAAHVAQFPLPVITGIGHDRDETVLDLIAHTRKKTPTAVAEFLIEQLQSFENQLDEQAYRLIQFTKEAVSEQQYELDRLYSSLKLSVVSNLLKQEHQLSQLQEQLKIATRRTLETERQAIESLRGALEKDSRQRLQDEERYLTDASRLMEVIDPVALLKRGFSITYVDNKPLAAVNKPKIGDKLLTKTASASYLSSLEKILLPDNAPQKDQ